MQSYIRHTRNLLSIMFACFGIVIPTLAQTSSESDDYLVKNKLYDFLIDYEKNVNASEFDQEKFRSFYYDTVVEVYNDLSQDLPQYIPLYHYLTELKKIKQNQPAFKFFHYNLELDKQFKGDYFNTIHISLLREIEIDTINSIKVSNTKIASAHFDITMLFNKYENNGNGAFKILKIEKADASILSGAWHQPLVPDEVKVSFGPAFVNFGDLNNPYISTSDNIGFDASVMIQNRFYGGRNYALSWFAGIGATFINSSWALGYDSATINQTDAFGDEYKRIITTRNVEQDISFSYLKIPLGISFKLFNGEGFSLSLVGEISPYYLLNSRQQTNVGEITYSGQYTLSNDGNNYDYLIANLGEDGYDFIPGNATTGRDEVLISEFGATAGFSIQANIAITKNIDLFVGSSWKWGVTDFLQSNTSENLLSLYDWEANPIIEQADGLRFNNTSIHAGVIFRLNNIVKPFVKKTKYKKPERTQQKVNFNNYLAKQIPNNFKEFKKTKTYTVSLLPATSENQQYPGKIKYAFNKETGIENHTLKVKSNNRVRASHHGMFLFKPFGYDIFKKTQETSDNAFVPVFIDSLTADTTHINISKLQDLNISLLIMNDMESGVRDPLIKTFESNIEKFGEQKCALYFWEDHGSTIEELDELFKYKRDCYLDTCKNDSCMINEVYKMTSPDEKPHFNFINELRILLGQNLIPGRSNINLFVYAGNYTESLNTLDDLLNVDLSFNDMLNKTDPMLASHPITVNHFKNITFYFIDYGESLKRKIKNRYNVEENEFSKSTYKLLYNYSYLYNSNTTKKKSIRFRDFEFLKLNYGKDKNE